MALSESLKLAELALRTDSDEIKQLLRWLDSVDAEQTCFDFTRDNLAFFLNVMSGSVLVFKDDCENWKIHLWSENLRDYVCYDIKNFDDFEWLEYESGRLQLALWIKEVEQNRMESEQRAFSFWYADIASKAKYGLCGSGTAFWIVVGQRIVEFDVRKVDDWIMLHYFMDEHLCEYGYSAEWTAECIDNPSIDEIKTLIEERDSCVDVFRQRNIEVSDAVIRQVAYGHDSEYRYYPYLRDYTIEDIIRIWKNPSNVGNLEMTFSYTFKNDEWNQFQRQADFYECSVECENGYWVLCQYDCRMVLKGAVDYVWIYDTLQVDDLCIIDSVLDKVEHPFRLIELALVKDEDLYPHFLSEGVDHLQEIALKAFEENVKLIRYLDNPSEELKKIAVEKDPTLISEIDNPSEEMQLKLYEKDPELIGKIHNPCLTLQELVIEQNFHLVKYLTNISEDLQLKLVAKNPKLINEIANPSVEAMVQAKLADPFMSIYRMSEEAKQRLKEEVQKKMAADKPE